MVPSAGETTRPGSSSIGRAPGRNLRVKNSSKPAYSLMGFSASLTSMP